MRFEDRFTEKAKAVLSAAHEAAASMGHGYVGSEHILLALLTEGGGIAEKRLLENGISRTFVLDSIEKYIGRGESALTTVQGLTPRAKHVIELAAADASRLKHSYVGTEHMLMGILREHESVAAKIIAASGADPNRIYSDLVDVFASPEYKKPLSERSGKRSDTRNLDQFSRDLTCAASKGLLDPVIGREREIQRVIQILSRRTKNNPILIGEPGVGKTAVAEGLAERIAASDVPETLAGRRVVSLDLTSMVAGTKYRGDFEDRIKNVIEDVKKAGDVILFIDEMHTIIGAGAAEGAIDASNILKPALSRGEIQVIGATTVDEFRRHIEKDAALERRFQPVNVEEPTPGEAEDILRGLRDKYEAHHRLKITDEAISAAVSLSARYINGRWLPDKAIDLIDEAASRVRLEELKLPPSLRALEKEISSLSAEKDSAIQNQDFERAASLRDSEKAKRQEIDALRQKWNDGHLGGKKVTAADVAGVVSSWTGIPVSSLSKTESQRLLELEKELHRRVIGQDKAVSAVSRAIRRGRVGLKDPRRPLGSFLFLGPSGVGKTELCRALAQAVFGDENAMVRIDMTEYMEKHASSRLIGSPPGYVGHDEGGQLTEKVRRKPYSVVLFDEIEKAHPDIWGVLLQIMDDGVLTDSRGRKVDFKNTIIIMTSNIGAKSISSRSAPLGFRSGEEDENARIQDTVMKEVKSTFKPEFLNRIDETVVFSLLSKDELTRITSNLLEQLAERVRTAGVSLSWDREAASLITERGSDTLYGARPLRREIQAKVEDPLSEMLLDGRLAHGDRALLTAKNGSLTIEKA